ncbi:MAG: TraR/DksA family transcriptional regulator [Burkholderiaceae bacterium]|nr:MAG: TraR/DksA family transcriptional regulator [Burkholderiaceae bacterium]
MNPALTTTLRAQLQQQLQARRDALDAQRTAHLAGQSRAAHAREVLLQDGDDATQRDAERTVDFDRTDRDAVSLAEVDLALQRLASGSYGLCSDCKAAIPLARLQLAPQAQRCVACESLLERGRARPATL